MPQSISRCPLQELNLKPRPRAATKRQRQPANKENTCCGKVENGCSVCAKLCPCRTIPEDFKPHSFLELHRYSSWAVSCKGKWGSGGGPSQGCHESRSSHTTNSRTLGGCTNRTTECFQELPEVS